MDEIMMKGTKYREILQLMSAPARDLTDVMDIHPAITTAALPLIIDVSAAAFVAAVDLIDRKSVV